MVTEQVLLLILPLDEVVAPAAFLALPTLTLTLLRLRD